MVAVLDGRTSSKRSALRSWLWATREAGYAVVHRGDGAGLALRARIFSRTLLSNLVTIGRPNRRWLEATSFGCVLLAGARPMSTLRVYGSMGPVWVGPMRQVSSVHGSMGI